MIDFGVARYWNIAMSSNFASFYVNGSTPTYRQKVELPYTITITANSGKYFTVAKSNYIAAIGDYDSFDMSNPLVIKKTFTDYDFDPDDWTFTSVKGTPPPPEPTFDLNINAKFLSDLGNIKGTLYINDVVAVEGNRFKFPYTVKLVANDGFEYVTSQGSYSPVLDDYNRFDMSNPKAITKTFNSSTGTFDPSDWTFTTQAAAEPEPTFDLNINAKFLSDLGDINGVLYVNDVAVVEGNSFNFPYTVKLVANDGYEYATSQGGYDPVEDDFNSFDMSNPKAITKTFNSSTGTFDPTDWTFTTQAAEPEPEPEPEPTFDYKVSKSFYDDLVSKKITMFVNGVKANAGDGFNYPFTVKMVADNTHIFTQFTSFPHYYDPIEDDYIKFNVIDERNVEYTFNGGYELDKFTFDTDIDESVVVPDKVAYNDVFVLTPEQAREIATTQFTYYKSPPAGSQAPSTPVPQGENIISFIDLPFIIDPSLIQGRKQIKIGVINSNITASYLNIDNYLLDLGNITVPDDKENYLSFENTTAILHLPYANPINIDVDYVIGQTINITYNVNFYDGIASVNITSTKINGVIDTKSIKLNINIPFGKPDDNPSDNAPRNIDFGIDNGVLRPYIEILRNDAILENGFFTIPVPDETLLIEQSGFIKIDEIDLKVKASKDEKEMILTAINQGVIIK